MLGPVQDFVVHHHAVNNMLLAQISNIFNSKWYMGEKTIGVRKGTLATYCMTLIAPTAEMRELSNEEEIDAAQEVDEEEEGDISGVIDYVVNLSIWSMTNTTFITFSGYPFELHEMNVCEEHWLDAKSYCKEH